MCSEKAKKDSERTRRYDLGGAAEKTRLVQLREETVIE